MGGALGLRSQCGSRGWRSHLGPPVHSGAAKSIQKRHALMGNVGNDYFFHVFCQRKSSV